MGNRRVIVLGLLLLGAPLPASAESAAPRALSAEHRLWLDEEVVLILSDVEREGFMRLADDDARETFITAFWKVRDPTPGTIENERRDEHYRRIAAANHPFGNSRRTGWNTARGQIFVQLGEPTDRTRYPSDGRIYPIEQWTYQGHRVPGLPGMFTLLFYKPFGSGDWELYDPVGDGPEKLTVGFQTGRRFAIAAAGDDDVLPESPPGSPTQPGQPPPQRTPRPKNRPPAKDRFADGRRALVTLELVSIPLRNASLSLDPSDVSDVRRGRAQSGTQRYFSIVSNLNNHQPVDLGYVDRVLEGKPDIKVEKAFEDHSLRACFHGGFGTVGGVVHYAIEVPPSSLQLQRNRDHAKGELEIFGRIFDAASNPVMEVTERVALDLSGDELERVRHFPFAFFDVLPLLPGTYEAHFVVRNLAGNDVGLVRGSIEVPQRSPMGLALGPLLIAAASREVPPGPLQPFTIGDSGYIPVFGGRLAADTELIAVFEIAHPSDRDKRSQTLSYDFSITTSSGKEEHSGRERLTIEAKEDAGPAVGIFRYPLKGLSPGRHTLTISLVDRDKRLASSADFEVEAATRWNPPWIVMADRDTRPDALTFALIQQHLEAHGSGDAVQMLEGLLDGSSPPAKRAARTQLAELLLQRDEYVSASQALEPLAADRGASPNVLLLLALARSGAGDGPGAIAALDRALTETPDDVDLLNLLGEEWARAGDETQALAALERSLAIDPKQEHVRELADSLR